MVYEPKVKRTGKQTSYPWHMLRYVGDHFLVMHSAKPHSYVSLMVAQRNYRSRLIQNRKKFATFNVGNATLVLLIRTNEEDVIGLFHGAEPYSPGVFVRSYEQIGESRPNAKRSQNTIIALMTLEERLARLPWWHDPGSREPVLNVHVMKPHHIKMYIEDREPIPDNNTPYPPEYGLDAKLNTDDDNEFSPEDFFRRSDADDEPGYDV